MVPEIAGNHHMGFGWQGLLLLELVAELKPALVRR